MKVENMELGDDVAVNPWSHRAVEEGAALRGGDWASLNLDWIRNTELKVWIPEIGKQMMNSSCKIRGLRAEEPSVRALEQRGQEAGGN